MRPRVLALVDGEHYPQVVRAALEQASATADVVAALLLGGTEKLAGDPDYGVPLETLSGDAASSMLEAAARHGADRVLDLSDEPVLSEKRRLWLAANALAAGLAYEGADFELRPPVAEPLEHPALAIVGTGKRVGKTAVSAHAARLLHAAGRDVVVVAMGRGGPAEPELVVPSDGPVGVAAAAGALASRDARGLRLPRGRRAGGCRHRRRAPLRRRPVGRHVPLERGRGGPAGRVARPRSDPAGGLRGGRAAAPCRSHGAGHVGPPPGRGADGGAWGRCGCSAATWS